MSDSEREAVEIAAKLTEAQRETLLGDPDEITWHNEEGMVFMDPPLVDNEEHMDGYDMWLTDLGLAVRQHLQEQSNDK